MAMIMVAFLRPTLLSAGICRQVHVLQYASCHESSTAASRALRARVQPLGRDRDTGVIDYPALKTRKPLYIEVPRYMTDLTQVHLVDRISGHVQRKAY